jgi:catechol 2,3-dioxygenase-like lactoylglutathione lyase family enzyme
MTDTLNEKDTMDTTGSPTGSIALANCFVTVDDPEAALGFYRDALGFVVVTDVSHGDYRWLTLSAAQQPELEIVINQVGSTPMSEEDREAQADFLAKGLLGGLIFSCDDVDALFEHVQATGAEVLQEPADQFYGVRDCAFRDPAGNLVRFKTPLQQG